MIRNALDATTHQRVSGQLGNRGTLAATFGNVLSSQARAAAFAEVQDMSRQQMAARLKSILDSEIAGIKKQRSRDLDGQRVVFDQARAALITRQDVERGKVREAWKLIYADRDRARSPYQQRSQQPAPIGKPPVRAAPLRIVSLDDRGFSRSRSCRERGVWRAFPSECGCRPGPVVPDQTDGRASV
jgi:hypothetical protein